MGSTDKKASCTSFCSCPCEIPEQKSYLDEFHMSEFKKSCH